MLNRASDQYSLLYTVFSFVLFVLLLVFIYTYITMNNIANLIHWFYTVAMPLGPIWILHSFYTISSIMILLWYLRYEKGYQSFSLRISKALALTHLKKAI